MFEKIPFFSYEGNYESREVHMSKDYEKMAEQHGFDSMGDEDYHIDGKSRYLLPHPMTEERKDKLIYLQSFCYMMSGCEYYTKRSHYASFLLLYTCQGRGELEYDGKKYFLNENDLFLIDCRKPHIYGTKGEFWNHLDLHFFGGISEYFYQENFSGKNPVFHCQQPVNYQNQLEKILMIHTGYSMRRDFELSHCIEELLLQILDYVETPQELAEIPDNFRFLINYLERHFQKEISLEDMAKLAGVSKYHLCRKFKQYTGFSPKEYLIHLRILQAETLLQDTELPGYKIGILVGLPNEANFIGHFKKKNGMSPGEYRMNRRI